MNGPNGTDARSVEDEHQQFARCLNELAVVRNADEADLVTRILRHSDTTMAQSAIVRHLDRRAAQLLADEGFTTWARAMAEISTEREFLGHDHPHALHTRLQRAQGLMSSGHSEQAQQERAQIVDDAERVLQPGHRHLTLAHRMLNQLQLP
ncbi:hypothetical protein ACFV6Z_29740 [Streptomyces sp. NPDC059818]|uniref:hypothetical protein n=1 Tax=Streptomyces sp. NPDC059818 TaxID=3346962 RepID=UPI003660D5DC